MPAPGTDVSSNPQCISYLTSTLEYILNVEISTQLISDMKPFFFFFLEKVKFCIKISEAFPLDSAEERCFLSMLPLLPPGLHNLLRQPETSRQFQSLKGEDREHQIDVSSDSKMGYKGDYQTSKSSRGVGQTTECGSAGENAALIL